MLEPPFLGAVFRAAHNASQKGICVSFSQQRYGKQQSLKRQVAF